MKKLEELNSQTQKSNTATSEGRQQIVNNCKELYNEIEQKLFNKYGQDAVNDAHNDLLNGNFAEPFYCEMKKQKFELYYKVSKNL